MKFVFVRIVFAILCYFTSSCRASVVNINNIPCNCEITYFLGATSEQNPLDTPYLGKYQINFLNDSIFALQYSWAGTDTFLIKSNDWFIKFRSVYKLYFLKNILMNGDTIQRLLPIYSGSDILAPELTYLDTFYSTRNSDTVYLLKKIYPQGPIELEYTFYPYLGKIAIPFAEGRPSLQLIRYYENDCCSGNLVLITKIH